MTTMLALPADEPTELEVELLEACRQEGSEQIRG
jgi:hypothetical protein